MKAIPNATVGLARGSALLVGAVVAAAGDLRASWAQWGRWGPLGPSQPVPAFTTHALDDEHALSRDTVRGKVTMLMFWATWCGACESQMPAIDELARQYADRGLEVWGISRDTGPRVGERVKAFANARDLSFPVVVDDGTAGRAFKVSVIPHVVLIDEEGLVRHVHPGRVARGTLADEIEDLLD